MDNLQKLQAANPHIQIHTIHEAAFRRYGSVIQEDTSAFCAAAETIPFPETGSKYVASTPELDEIPAAAKLREIHCGGLDEQIGAGGIPISSTLWSGIPATSSTSPSGSWFCCWRSGKIWTRTAG